MKKELTTREKRIVTLAEKFSRLKEEDANYVSGVMDGMLIRESIEKENRA